MQVKRNTANRVCATRDRETVLRHARDLLADGTALELSAAIRRRTGLSESRIDRIIASEMIAARAEADTLRAAILGGIDAAREARADVIEELG